MTTRYNFLLRHAELTPVPPVIVAVHDPSPLPGPATIPFVTAQVEPGDSSGIDSVWLYWRDKNYGRFAVAQMFDDGAHGDGAANDHLYGGATTNYPAGHKIHYYVEARAANSAKAAAFSPARAEQDTYSYRVALAAGTNTSVVINELLAQNTSALVDPQGDFDDWIELRNLTGQEINLTGLYLTDQPDNPKKWAFPDGTKIAPNGYLLVWADEDTTDTLGLHANFKLSSEGEELYLIDTDGNLNAVLDSVTFGRQTADRSYGRLPSAPNTFGLMSPTPLQANVEP